KLLVGSTEVGASEEYPLPPAFGGRGLVLTVLHVCQQATTSDRGCFFDQSPRSSKLRNTCVVFGALVSHSPLKISFGLSGGLCQLLLDQLDLSVSFALNFLDSLDQQVFICRLLHCDDTISILEDQRSSVKRQAALLMKFTQRSGAFIRASLIVETVTSILSIVSSPLLKIWRPVALRGPTKLQLWE